MLKCIILLCSKDQCHKDLAFFLFRAPQHNITFLLETNLIGYFLSSNFLFKGLQHDYLSPFFFPCCTDLFPPSKLAPCVSPRFFLAASSDQVLTLSSGFPGSSPTTSKLMLLQVMGPSTEEMRNHGEGIW